METQFKTITHLKINWLKNASKEFGAMKMVIDSKPKENNVIKKEPNLKVKINKTLYFD